MADNLTPWTPPAGAASYVDAQPAAATTTSWTPPDGQAAAADLNPQQLEIFNRVRASSAEELHASGFRADEALASVPDGAFSPEDIDKLNRVTELHRSGPYNVGRAVSAAISGAPELVGNFIKGAGGVIKRGAEILNPSTAAPDREKATAELLSAVEAGSTGTAGLVRQGARKIGDLIGGPPSHEESKNRLFEDAAIIQQHQKINQAQGEFAKATGFDADTLVNQGIQVDPEAINQMSNVADLTNLVPLGAGFAAVSKVTGKTLFTAATREAAEAFSKALGEKLVAAGKGITGISKAIKIPATPLGVAAGLLAHSAGVGTGLALGVKALPLAGRATGAAVEGAGKVLTGEAGPIGRTVATGVVGGTAGLAASLPLAASADYEEDAGRIAGGGALLGAAGGLTHGVAREGYKAGQDVAQSTATKAFQDAAAAPPILDTSTRTEPTWAAAHDESMQKLRAADPATANLVDRISTVLPAIVEASNPNAPMPELYVFDGPRYKKLFEGTEKEPQAGFYDADANRLVIRLDGSNAEALRHEPSHLIFDLLPEGQQREVFKTIEKAYGEAGIEHFAKTYQDRFNRDLPPSQRRTFDPSDPTLRQYLLTEVAVENLSNILRGDRLDGSAPSVMRTLGEKATKVFESLGLYKPGIGGTPNKTTVTELGVGVSPKVRETLAPFLRGKLQSPEVAAALDAAQAPKWTPPTGEASFKDHPVAPTPPTPAPPEGLTVAPPPRAQFEQPAPANVKVGNPPAGLAVEPPNPENFGGFGHRSFENPPELRAEETPKPVIEAPKPTVRAEEIQKPENIRGVTDEQVAKLSAARDDMQIAQAAAAVKTPHEQQVFSDLVKALEGSTRGNTPLLEVVHNSIKSEVDPNARQARRTEQEAGRAAEANGSTEQRVETTKRLVPTGFSVTAEGKAQLFAQSADKVLGAVNEGIVAQAEAHGIADKVPYDNHSGHLTPEGESQFLQDLAAYTANQANGYRGDGKRLIRPVNYDGVLPPENADFKPTAIEAKRAQFLNMVVAGGELTYPKTTRVQKNPLTGVTIKPRNIAARELAEANAGVVLKPAKPGPKNQAFEDFGGTEIAEFNPLRQQFEKAGVDVRQKFIGAPEKINLADIKSVKALPGRAFQAPSIDMTRAGFMPALTKSGKDLEDRGYSVDHSNSPHMNSVIIRSKMGHEIGSITLTPSGKDSKEVSMVDVATKHQGKGFGETLYREALTQLQKEGVKKLTGMVIDPRPIALREKLFGGVDKITLRTKRGNNVPTQELSAEEAKGLIASLRGTGQIAHIDVENRIRPDLRFMPMQPQYVGKKRLPNSVEEPVKVVHYSSDDVKKVDPKFFGKGKATRNDLRGDNKTFFFEAGSSLGADRRFFGEGSSNAYGAIIDGSRLYDLTAGKPDPLKWTSTINRLEADEAVKDAGYAGIRIDTGEDDGRKVVLMFKPVKVQPFGTPPAGDVALRFMPRNTVAPDSKLKSEEGFVYHATNLENAEDISKSGSLGVFAPDYGTDQATWPDGSEKPRSYWSAKANTVWQFAPENGKPVVLRTRKTDAFKDESTGDIYSAQPINAKSIEILTADGWKALVEDPQQELKFMPKTPYEKLRAAQAAVDSASSDRQLAAAKKAFDEALGGMILQRRKDSDLSGVKIRAAGAPIKNVETPPQDRNIRFMPNVNYDEPLRDADPVKSTADWQNLSHEEQQAEVQKLVALNAERDNLIGDMKLPDGWRMLDINTSTWDSVYFIAESPEGDRVKARISNHDSKATRHGPNNYELTLPTAYTLRQFSEAIKKVQNWFSEKNSAYEQAQAE